MTVSHTLAVVAFLPVKIIVYGCKLGVDKLVKIWRPRTH